MSYNSNLQKHNVDLQSILDTINALPEASNGVELPSLTNEGTASDLLLGKQLIDGEGNIVEGTIPTKTVSNLSASGATVTVPAGYYATQVTKSVTTATQSTPSITVNSSGLITASATQTAGYVTAGSKSATKQLTTQAAKTYTPSTTNQTIASGTYLTGTQTIKGDSNLVAGNIKSGVSIFGITGTYQSIGEDVTAETTVYTNELANLQVKITALENALTEVLGSTIISFTIKGISYQAEEGMTWEEWINSSYNTDGCHISYGAVYSAEGGFINGSDGQVNPSDVIVENIKYTTSAEGIEEDF